jgi:dihydrofolate synthase / folylpolyglutamate synthase
LVNLPGRFQIIAGQPTLVLDVAHNPHAVSALFENLDAMGFFPNTYAVMGVMADKDISAVLRKMAPVVTHWYFTDLPTPRALSAEALKTRLLALRSPNETGTVACFSSPSLALKAALTSAAPTDRIVVFGSFYTVGDVLKEGIPRLNAPHV